MAPPAKTDIQNAELESQRLRVKELAGEDKELYGVYVKRVDSFVQRLMASDLSDADKQKALEKLKGYLELVSATNIKGIITKFEPVLAGLEGKIPSEVKKLAELGHEAHLEGIRDPEVRIDLAEKFSEASRSRVKYATERRLLDMKVERLRNSGVDTDGTELQQPLASLEYHADFLENCWKDYQAIDSKDPDHVGKRRDALSKYNDHVSACLEVLDALNKRIDGIPKKPLEKISLEKQAEDSLHEMIERLKRFGEQKERFLKQVDALRISHDDPLFKDLESFFEGFDLEISSYKVIVFEPQKENESPEKIAERALAAKRANELLTKAFGYLEEQNHLMDAIDFTQGTKTGREAVKIFEKAGIIKKLLGLSATFIVPQVVVYSGYVTAAQGPMSTEDKVLEATDFGISLIPFAGGIYDVVAAVRGKTLSGREMNTTECWIRAGIGVGSFALDCFTFGAGGVLLKAGGKAVAEAGAKVVAKETTKVVMEGAAKGLAEAGTKGLVEAGGRVLTKEAMEAAGKALEEVAAKEGIELLTGTAGEAARHAIINSMKSGATVAEKAVAREVFVNILKKQLESAAKKLAKESLAKKAGAATAEEVVRAEAKAGKFTTKLAKENAALATPYLHSVRGGKTLAGVVEKVTLGAVESGGAKSIESGLARVTARESAIQAAQAASKSGPLFKDYYLAAEFMKDGEFSVGRFALGMGKEMGKGWLHLHDPRAVLRLLMHPLTWAKRLLKSIPQGSLIGNKVAIAAFEEQAKARLIVDGHYDAKVVEEMFADARRMSFDEFMKVHGNKPGSKEILETAEGREFFESYTHQFDKAAVVDVRTQPQFPFVQVTKAERFKAKGDLKDIFETMAPNTFMLRRNMLKDARKMSFEEFIKAPEYKAAYDALPKPQQHVLRERFERFQSLNPGLPANIKKVKEAVEQQKLTAEVLRQAEGDLKALRDEKTLLDDLAVQHQAKCDVAAAQVSSHIPYNLSVGEKRELWSEIFDKLKDGKLKEAIVAERKVLAEAKGATLVDGSSQMKELTGEAMASVVGSQKAEIDSSIAEATTTLAEAKAAFDEQKVSGVPFQPKELKRHHTLKEAAEKRFGAAP